MESLFDNLPKQEKGLAVTKSATAQSKKQKEFLKHTANVEKLKTQIAEKTEHLKTLEIYYAKEIVPTMGIMGRAGFNLAKAIADSINKVQCCRLIVIKLPSTINTCKDK